MASLTMSNERGQVFYFGILLFNCRREEVMARPLRIEYPGAFYHITTRGNVQSSVYKDDEDKQSFL